MHPLEWRRRFYKVMGDTLFLYRSQKVREVVVRVGEGADKVFAGSCTIPRPGLPPWKAARPEGMERGIRGAGIHPVFIRDRVQG